MDAIVTEMIEYPSNGGTTPAYVARPAGGGPGLVAIQEYWGLVPHIKDVADRFARQGYVTLAPDLYHGQAATEPDEARKLAMELDRERAVREIRAAIAYLMGQAAVHPKKVGVVGWCMGGGLALAVAAADPDLDAAVAFYGLPRDLQSLRAIRAPILGLYGAHDHSISLERVRDLDHLLTQNGVAHSIQVYPAAGHAFFNDSRPSGYNAQAAQDAWQQTLDWLRRYLKE